MKRKKIFIVSSNEYYFAINVFKNLVNKNFDVEFINVFGFKSKASIKRKIKLAILFGIVNTLKFLIISKVNKYKFAKYTIHLKNHDFQKKLNQLTKIGNLFLINFPSRVLINEKIRIFNCHPGELPTYRGLFPIPRSLLGSYGNEYKITSTVHQINNEFDMGFILNEKKFLFKKNTSIFEIYNSVYGGFSDQISDINNQINHRNAKKVISKGIYSSDIYWKDIFKLKLTTLVECHFIKFLINGGLLGLLSWLIQTALFKFIVTFSYSQNLASSTAYGFSVVITFSIIAILNFHSQKRLVFKTKNGKFINFLLITLFLIILVSSVSTIIFEFLISNHMHSYLYLSYPISALLLCPIAFMMKKKLIFKK